MKNAVITGTSTGIGLTTSLHMARNGYRVFAGMRNVAKAEALRTATAKLRFLIRCAAHSALISEHGMPHTFSV